MTDQNKISALILAAGRSSRMGALKPMLFLGRQRVIETVIGSFRTAGFSDILVVLGHQADDLTPVLKQQAVRWVINDQYDRGMFSSIQVGVRGLDRDCRAFFLMPADMPMVRPETLRKLVEVQMEKGTEVCHPRYGQKRGHPPLIASTLIPSILAFKETGGLRLLLSRHEGTVRDVDCEDPGVLIDLDTPDDYKTVQDSLQK